MMTTCRSSDQIVMKGYKPIKKAKTIEKKFDAFMEAVKESIKETGEARIPNLKNPQPILQVLAVSGYQVTYQTFTDHPPVVNNHIPEPISGYLFKIKKEKTNGET